MIKEKLFKILFPEKVLQIETLEDLIETQNETILKVTDGVASIRKELEDIRDREPSLADLMRDSLGLPMVDFSNVDENGMPPSYLDGLTDTERKNYVADLELIYNNKKFHEVVSYIINLFGNNSLRKATDENGRNGKIAIVAIDTLMRKFKEAHDEHVANRKIAGDDFDPLAVLPE